MQHCFSEDLLFGIVHAVEKYCHQQRADLVISDGPASNAFNKENYLFAGELRAVALLTNDVLRSQLSSLHVKQTASLRRSVGSQLRVTNAN